MRCLFCKRPYKLKGNGRLPMHKAREGRPSYTRRINGVEIEQCWGSDLTNEEQRRKISRDRGVPLPVWAEG